MKMKLLWLSATICLIGGVRPRAAAAPSAFEARFADFEKNAR